MKCMIQGRMCHSETGSSFVDPLSLPILIEISSPDSIFFTRCTHMPGRIFLSCGMPDSSMSDHVFISLSLANSKSIVSFQSLPSRDSMVLEYVLGDLISGALFVSFMMRIFSLTAWFESRSDQHVGLVPHTSDLVCFFLCLLLMPSTKMMFWDPSF